MPSILQITLTLLASALGGVLLSRILNLPPILGYLVVGLLIGPNAANLAPDSDTVKNLAEFGVVFLMFSIGLEFNLAKLKSMRQIVFRFGASQVFLTMLLTIPAGYLLRFLIPLPMPWHVLFALGGAVAMSSTAIVIKALSERGELDTEHGKNVIGVLLFQDLVVILLLILIPSLGKNPGDIALALTLASIKVTVALTLIFIVGQKLFSSWFRVVANFRSQELFMLNVLLVSIGMAGLTEHFGLSMALGAFMAGMLIAETPYRHQVEQSIESFRDILLGLFFITVGMLVDFQVVLRDFHLVLFLFFGALALKFVIITGLAKRFGSSTGVALRTGLCLTQAGEFGFVLINQLDSLDWIDPDLSQAVMAAMLLSMLVAPILIQYSDRIVLRFSRNEWLTQSVQLTKIVTQTIQHDQHVIICGFGITGQHVANLLEQEGIRYVALDADPDRVQEASDAGKSVVYGAYGVKGLIAAGIARAKVVVIAFNHIEESAHLIKQIEELHPGIAIIVRASDDSDLELLQKAGATQVIPEKIEGGLMLAAHTLSVLGVPIRRVMRRITEARENRYGKLKGHFPSAEEDDGDSPESIRLHTIRLGPNMRGINQTLSFIEQTGAVVQSLRRKENKMAATFKQIILEPNVVIQEDDILVLLGTMASLEAAEKLITKPSKNL